MSRLVQSIGNVVAPDQVTYCKTRGNVAKANMEINLPKPKKESIWLGFKRPDSTEDDK